MTHPAALIKNIWAKYSGDFKPLMIASLPFALAITVANVLGIFFPLSRAEAVLPLPKAATIAIYAVVLAAYIIFSFASSIALYLNAGRVFENQKAEIKEPYRKSVQIFLSVLLVSVLRTLITLGGLLLLIVPGIVWGIRYMFAEQAAIFEGKRGREALSRSRELTDGKIFSLFVDIVALLIVLVGAVVVISWAVSLAIYILGSIVYSLSGSETVGLIITYITYAAILVIRYLALILPFLAIVALYRDSKENHA